MLAMTFLRTPFLRVKAPVVADGVMSGLNAPLLGQPVGSSMVES